MPSSRPRARQTNDRRASEACGQRTQSACHPPLESFPLRRRLNQYAINTRRHTLLLTNSRLSTTNWGGTAKYQPSAELSRILINTQTAAPLRLSKNGSGYPKNSSHVFVIIDLKNCSLVLRERSPLPPITDELSGPAPGGNATPPGAERSLGRGGWGSRVSLPRSHRDMLYHDQDRLLT